MTSVPATVAQHYPIVVGVDTHAKNHVYAAVASTTGEVLDVRTYPTTRGGLSKAITWIQTLAPHHQVLTSIEGALSWGATLTRALTRAGLTVTEAPTPRRGRADAKDDHHDAIRAARNVLAQDITRLASPKMGTIHEDTRVLLSARRTLTQDKNRTILALTALIRDYDLIPKVRSKITTTQITTIASWRPTPTQTHYHARKEAHRLAQRLTQIHTELEDNKAELDALTTHMVPELTDLCGLGPVIAAKCLEAYSHHGRVRNDAAFARLAGTCPIPASSGNTTRHRLNRSGDRELNQHIHHAIVTRLRWDPNTITYMNRRLQEGKTKREIMRCLKRHLTRTIYKTLKHIDLDTRATTWTPTPHTAA